MKKHLFTLAMTLFASSAAFADDWMARLSDAAYIDQLSIPGTHDAATGNGTDADAFARTQELSLSEQFDCGIRAFDLRPSADGGTLRLYHGTIATKLTFDDAMNQFCDMLDDHSTEFVVVLMRHEDDHESNSEKAAWNELMKTSLASERLAGRLVTFSNALTVGDMRGKILLLSRDKYDSKPAGGFINSWTHSTDFAEQSKANITGGSSRFSAPLHVQDFYATHNAIDTKCDLVRAVLDYAATLCTAEVSGHRWVINHTSGYDATLFATADAYRKNAAAVNVAAIAHLAASDREAGPTGLVMMDFAGTDRSSSYDVKGKELTQAVIDNNFRYVMKAAATSGMASPAVAVPEGGEAMQAGADGIYGLDGRKLCDDAGATAPGSARKGVYIIRKGGKTLKVVR